MALPIGRVSRTTLADDLTDRLLQMIRSGDYQPGDRLPAIMHMAQSFGVGHPTLREALRKLEVIGAVEIRHGSGVYVKRGKDMLLVSNPTFAGGVSKKLLLDLVEARTPIETTAIALAASNATEEHIAQMTTLLGQAEAAIGDGDEADDEALSEANMAFHREIAVASGNAVLAQMQEVLSTLFQKEQRVILDIYGSREKDHREHEALLDAIRQGDATLAEDRMRAHLGGVREVVRQWDPDQTPLA